MPSPRNAPPGAVAARPQIGARVRLRAGTGIPGVTGRVGIITAYHVDGVAFRVELDGGRLYIVSPQDVEIIPNTRGD